MADENPKPEVEETEKKEEKNLSAQEIKDSIAADAATLQKVQEELAKGNRRIQELTVTRLQFEGAIAKQQDQLKKLGVLE
jgi:hypothetical protein